jgi:hypothetical protein
VKKQGKVSGDSLVRAGERQREKKKRKERKRK